MTSSTESGPETSRLQAINYANVFAYVLNLVVTFGSSQFLPDNAELSAKYQTLVTPAGWAFAIWGIIFTAELILTIAQVLPAYRSSELVIKGVGYNFVAACVAQAAWSIIFGFERIGWSLLAMVCILIPLIVAVTQLGRLPAGSLGRYWLLKFPIEIHAAWIMAATLVNTNTVLVASNVSANVQAIGSFVSLVVVLVAGLYYIVQERWVVPSVLAWASFAIASELANPRDSITTRFAAQTIEQTRIASLIVASTVLALAIAKILYDRIIMGRSSFSSSSTTTTTTTAGGENGTNYAPLS